MTLRLRYEVQTSFWFPLEMYSEVETYFVALGMEHDTKTRFRSLKYLR